MAREPVSREIFLPSPAAGTAVIAQAWYTRASGGEMRSLEQRLSRSDTVDEAYYRTSRDHGRTWSEPSAVRTGERRAGGMWRFHPRPGFLDKKTGRAIDFWVEGVLPTDDPLEGMRQWNIFYRVDGGERRQIIHEGGGYDTRHPLPGIYTARTMAMLGDATSAPVTAPNGEILVPATVTTLGADGKVYNPTGGYTYTAAMLLHGRWRGGELVWRAGPAVEGDPKRSTRGMDEPTVEALTRGRLIMVLRGSNDRDPSLPAYRWVSFSSDGGGGWTAPRPWTWHDGQPFYSPSAGSQLLRLSNGRLFWAGHISAANARGNRPRYPVYVAEVDQDSGLLIRDSLRMVDDRAPGEDEILMIYPPYVREDRESGGVAMHASRLFLHPGGFTGDAMVYRIRV